VCNLPKVVHFQFGNPGRTDSYARFTISPQPQAIDFYGIPEIAFHETMKEQESGQGAPRPCRPISGDSAGLHFVLPPQLTPTHTLSNEMVLEPATMMTMISSPDSKKFESELVRLERQVESMMAEDDDDVEL